MAIVEIVTQAGVLLDLKHFETNQEAADLVVELLSKGYTVNHQPNDSFNPTLYSLKTLDKSKIGDKI